jgi:hypothetical protein
MTTTTAQPQLPLPAGAINADDWHRLPHDQGHIRTFNGRTFPVTDWLRVRTGGVEIVDDSGQRTIARQVRIDADSNLYMFHQGAVKLADALVEAAVYVAELERADKAADTA